MIEHCSFSRTFKRRIAIAASILTLTAASYPAIAQTDTGVTENGHEYSSSTDWKAYLTSDDLDGSPMAPAPKPAGQYGQSNNRYPGYESRWSHLAIEAGGGFTAPVGNTAHGYETWGYNIKAGAGWNFTKRFGALIEYQFNRDKIPGSTLAVIGAPGGNINTWSFTIDPIIYQPLTKKTGVYVTGGGGFYRKVTNFTAPQQVLVCYYFCYVGYQNVTIGHFSSNQGGLNIGAGYYWKAFGEDSNAKLFAEARYLWVNSPSATQTTNGEGTSSLIPVTFGIRF